MCINNHLIFLLIINLYEPVQNRNCFLSLSDKAAMRFCPCSCAGYVFFQRPSSMLHGRFLATYLSACTKLQTVYEIRTAN